MYRDTPQAGWGACASQVWSDFTGVYGASGRAAASQAGSVVELDHRGVGSHVGL
jgi:hypothetical protein